MVDFEYLSLLAISLDESSLNFGLIEPGSSSEIKTVNVVNRGNVNVDLEMYGSDLENENNNINVNSIKFKYNETWNNLNYRPSLFDFNLESGLNKNKQLEFRLDLPSLILPNKYTGKINLVGIEE